MTILTFGRNAEGYQVSQPKLLYRFDTYSSSSYPCEKVSRFDTELIQADFPQAYLARSQSRRHIPNGNCCTQESGREPERPFHTGIDASLYRRDVRSFSSHRSWRLTSLSRYVEDPSGPSSSTATDEPIVPGSAPPPTNALVALVEQGMGGQSHDERVRIGLVSVVPGTGDVVYDEFDGESPYLMGDRPIN